MKKIIENTKLLYRKLYIEYFMESACVRCLHTSCGVSEIDREQVSEAKE